MFAILAMAKRSDVTHRNGARVLSITGLNLCRYTSYRNGSEFASAYTGHSASSSWEAPRPAVATYTKLSPVAPTAVMTIPRVNYSVFS